MLKFFWCIVFSVQVFAQSYYWEGKVYDDDTVAELITVITSTSPIRSHPSTRHIYDAQKSLFQVPALAKCKKIIVFDGFKSGSKYSASDYAKYKKNVQRLVQTDPYFAGATLIFCPMWGHLSGTLKAAIEEVKTPFIFVHQHDLVLLQSFDLNGVVASMVANPNIQQVHLGKRANQSDDWFHGPVHELVDEIHFVPLCRSCGWSDQCHVSSVEYYRSFVLPKCHKTFMEHVMHPILKQAVKKEGIKGRESFGTYLYGNLFDGPYILHTDGRNH